MQFSEVQELYNLFASIQNVLFSSVKISLAVLEFYEQLQPLENRRVLVQNNLISQLGHKNEDGSFSIDPTDDKYFEFVKQYNELQVTEVSITKPSMSLEDFANLQLTPNQVKSLRNLLTIEI